MSTEYEGKTREDLIRELEELKVAQENLMRSLTEKDVLLKEVHHRVKNNLQIIVSLMSLQSLSMGDDASKGIYDNMKNRVKSMALVHESLYKSTTLSTISFSDYLKSLVSALFRSYRRPGPAIRSKLDVSDLDLDIEKAVPCGLIVNEALTNSLKHAFPNDMEGDIKIAMSTEGENVILEISDNGVGIPADILPEKLDSLGIKLIYMLADQIGGTVELERDNGTTWRITFSR